jgi:hypothetical protein
MVDLAEIQATYYMVAATGVLVAAIYYVYNMRISQKNMKANLETRQTQLFMDIWKVFSSKEYQKDREQMFATWQFSNYEDFFKKYGPDVNPEDHSKFDMMCSYLEGIEVLIRRGMISPDLVYDLMYGTIATFWNKFQPVIKEMRVVFKNPGLWLRIESLYNEMERTRSLVGSKEVAGSSGNWMRGADHDVPLDMRRV